MAQSNRGDQLIAHHSDMPEVPPEEPEDYSAIDTTVCHAADLRADDSDPPVAVAEAQVTGQVALDPNPLMRRSLRKRRMTLQVLAHQAR